MKNFSRMLLNLKDFAEICDSFGSGRTPMLASGLSGIHKAHFIYAITQIIERQGLVITPDEPSSLRICEDINAFFGPDHQQMAFYYPARELTYRDVEGVSREYEHARLKVLGLLSGGDCPIVVASAEAALLHTMPPQELKARTVAIHPGESFSMEELVALLLKAGYEGREQVEGVCQFSHRGGILDFYPPQSADPYRVEFWGDEVDTICQFKTDTQRRSEVVEEAVITPAREVLYDSPEGFRKTLCAIRDRQKGKAGVAAKEHLQKDIDRLEGGLTLNSIDKYLPVVYEKPATLFDYFSDAALFVSDPIGAKDALKNLHWQLQEDIKIMLEEGILFPGCTGYIGDYVDLLTQMERWDTLILDTFTRNLGEIPLKGLYNIEAVQLSVWSGEFDLLKEDLTDYLGQEYCAIVMAGTKRAAAALTDDLQKAGISADYVENLSELRRGKVLVTDGALSAGFEYPRLKLAVITHGRAAASAPRKHKAAKKGDAIKSLADLTPGDYVVHVAHGIGVFEGIIKRDIHGVVKDYIKIRYAGTDTLFVPVTQLDLVSKYIGAREDSGVKLNKLNSVEWSKTRQRVKKAVADMAQELIRLYSQRMQLKGYAFGPDTDWQRDFEDRFPYEETDDQLRCIDEIKADMERPVPMDRLLCGDVGFGKTEVAIRAAFKAVMDGKQVAVLVPTTILAWQHYQTFRNRMNGFPIKVEVLSRYRTAKQQEEILRELRRGEVDIIIGTHRVIQKDVTFKDLGLCIIDEEQRFGVAHKEKFKEMRGEVDVLTLSATPIPRTLNMAMSGIRDMSVIEEAPQDRHPVQTYVLEHDWGVLGEAMRRELRRGGQVFYLHNHVESIDSCAFKIQQMLPDARVVSAHGKMGEEQLSRVWKQLNDHEIDILVCTTIIETGVDVSNCNTLIIENADRMGLSQLYQLRGRVGRSNRRAFAYLTFTRGKALSDVATKRLAAIREFTSFGSGFRIAMRDLEIRGAGNVLGAQQHGHMEAVGYDMYLRLLSEAVGEQRGEAPPKTSAECMVDIRIGAHIPEEYISNLSQRIDIYKKIAAIQNKEDSMDVLDELIDRFGDPPQAVKGLVDVALVRNTAAGLGIKEISERGDAVWLIPEQLDMERVSTLAAKLPGRVMVNAGAKPYITVKIPKGKKALDTIREALSTMQPEGAGDEK